MSESVVCRATHGKSAELIEVRFVVEIVGVLESPDPCTVIGRRFCLGCTGAGFSLSIQNRIVTG